MSRWKKKRKKWLDHYSRINVPQHRKKKRLLYEPNKSLETTNAERETYADQSVVVRLTVPERFSLTQNTDETMRFFMQFFEELKKKQYRKQFFIDSSRVKEVTVDAIIYLIAIMENYIGNKEMNYAFHGNLPLEETAKSVFMESGFFDYVVSRVKKLPKSTEKMQIISGNKNDPTKAREFSEFVMQKLGKKRTEIFEIQSILIELMSNVYHHAYVEGDYMYRKWYMYAEHVKNGVRFVFVDTGAGIAKTVRRNFSEKIRELFGAIKDGDLLLSTFNGDYRTSTQKENRGNGLQTVKMKVQNGPFTKFDVISGHGKCSIDAMGSAGSGLTSVNYEETIFGTLYTFEVN